MINPITQARRHYEDLTVGEVFVLAPRFVTAGMIKDFARQYDPLPFHLDEEFAKSSILGGLAASGFQTGGLTLRGLVEGFLGQIASAGGLGFSDLRWLAPVMAGDEISGTGTITGLRVSRSRPHWGIVSIRLDVRNQTGRPVMEMSLDNLVDVRSAQRPERGA